MDSMNISKIASTVLLVTLISCSSTGKHESTGQYIDSATITAKIKAKIVSHDKLSAMNITVVTYKNNVQLSGFVSSDRERKIAEEIAISITGVLTVTNSLIIKKD